MRVWPSASFEIDTSMSVGDIIASLDSQTEPAERLLYFPFGPWAPHRRFRGTISGDDFKIRPTFYWNNFLPIIRGTFRPGASGTTIAITMGLHPFTTALLCVWFGGVGLGILAVLAGLSRGQTDPMLLIPFGALLFGWALAFGSFWFEANKTKSILFKMFSGGQARTRD